MTEHERWMEQAFIEAEKAFSKNEVPVGAVIVSDSRVIGRGHNLIESLQDPTAHAEILAITAAANALASWRLDEATIYITLEPCPMCAGAILAARIPKVVFGAPDSKFGAAGSVIDLLKNQQLNTSVEVHSDILKEKCQSILKNFFEKIRQE